MSADRRARTPPASALVLLGAGLLVLAYLVREILLPFVLAGIVAFVFTPVVRRLAARTGLARVLAATAVLVVLLTLAALVGWLWAPRLAAALEGVGRGLPATLTRVIGSLLGAHRLKFFGAGWSAAEIAAALTHSLHAWLARPASPAHLLLWGGAAVFELILTVVLLGYFLLDAARIARGLAWLVPPAYREVLYQAARECAPLVRRYFAGVALVALYAGCLAEIGLGAVLGLPHAPVLALITGVLELIPFVGPTGALLITALNVIGQLPGAWGVAAFAVYAATLRISIDQFVGPLLLGRAADLPPVLVIFCFLCGGVIFGVAGAILAVPAALGIKVLLGVIYRAQEVR